MTPIGSRSCSNTRWATNERKSPARRTGRREKLLIREECGYYKIRWTEGKKQERKARDENQENFKRFRKEANRFGSFLFFFLFSPLL